MFSSRSDRHSSASATARSSGVPSSFSSVSTRSSALYSTVLSSIPISSIDVRDSSITSVSLARVTATRAWSIAERRSSWLSRSSLSSIDPCDAIAHASPRSITHAVWYSSPLASVGVSTWLRSSSGIQPGISAVALTTAVDGIAASLPISGRSHRARRSRG